MGEPLNFHETLQGKRIPQPGSNRGFGVAMASVCVVIAIVSLWIGSDYGYFWLAAAAALALLAGFSEQTLGPLNRLWFKLGRLLHRVVSPILMGATFFGVITPVGLLMRAVGRGPLSLKISPSEKSYWEESRRGTDTMDKQY